MSDEEVIARLNELEIAVEEIEETLATVTGQCIPLLTATVRHAIAADIESMEDLPNEGREFSERLHEIETHLAEVDERLTQFGDISPEASTKEQKFVVILEYAANKQRGDQSRVSVSATEIKGCVGVSRRYAYDLLEAMAKSVDGCQLREAQSVQTSTGVKQKRKALLVDCEEVHSNHGDVNQFTTGGGG
ncbi:hypothetical protein ACFQH3_19185 [Haladaptatus sp. GCM10025707]|uniref:hypothetical protein n=1 Tax=unclassified Haladaptatus TaxID=2622732 RepID=UPI0023E8B1C7|nr:hypothetical protein [Haladaptatus sp. QDMS2]